MTEKSESLGVDHEDASLMLGLSTTSSKALATPAGRGLNIQIADQVMLLDPEKWRHSCFVHRHNIDDYVWCYDCGQCADESEKIPPLYSTSIADAWLVVEKLKADGCEVYVTNSWPYNHGKNWMCQVGPGADDGAKIWIEGKAKTAPLAICLAALKAVA